VLDYGSLEADDELLALIAGETPEEECPVVY
jgi:hypothetical protein